MIPHFRPGRAKAPIVLFAALALLLGACAGEKDAYVERPVEELYNTAMAQLEARKFKEAASLFDEVERQHPYSVWAAKAQIMAAYAYYEGGSYDDAIVALQRFIQLHPTNRDIAYAHYLLALSYYDQISDVTRDQRMTNLALNALNEVVNRFPTSKYARDAIIKIDLAEDHLAGKEMEIGRGYQIRGQLIAAVNRFRNVVDNYDTTTHVPEALHRLVECYLALGMTEEARKAASVLGHNFPGSEWYVDSFEIVEGEEIRPRERPWYKLW